MCNACIWGHSENRRILGIQYSAMRFLLGVGRVCPITGLVGERGWVPFSMTIKFSILRYRNRIRHMDDNRLIKKVYALSLSLSGRYPKNWTEKTKVLLESIGDFSGLLNYDEIWDSLAKQEANRWKEAVTTIPKDSDREGRFVYYRQVK